MIITHQIRSVCASVLTLWAMMFPHFFPDFCFFCFIAHSFHGNSPNTTQQSGLCNSFSLAFYFVSQLVRLCVCLRRSVRERGVWRGPEPEWRGRGRDVSPQVTINTQKRQVEKLWYGMIQSLCCYFRSQRVVNVSWTSWCSYRSGSSLGVPREGGLESLDLQISSHWVTAPLSCSISETSLAPLVIYFCFTIYRL